MTVPDRSDAARPPGHYSASREGASPYEEEDPCDADRPAALPSLLTLALGLMLPAAASAKEPPKPYLALGDSLAVGVQPLATGESVNTLRATPPSSRGGSGDVKVVNYGCGNATTESFIKGDRPCLPARDPGYANTSPRPPSSPPPSASCAATAAGSRS